MSEPVYEYVKGQGWVASTGPGKLPGDREFTWNSKRWLIRSVDVAMPGVRNWMCSHDLTTCSAEELQNTSKWWNSTDPGWTYAEPRKRASGLHLSVFIPVD